MIYQELSFYTIRCGVCAALLVLSSEALSIGDKADVKLTEVGQFSPGNSHLWLQTVALVCMIAVSVAYILWPRASPEEKKLSTSIVSGKVEDLGDHRCVAAAFTLGVLNNVAYAIVMGAAQPLAKEFGTEDLMALFSTITMLSCLCVALLNSSLCLQIRLDVRVSVLLVFSVGAYLVLSMATLMGGVEGFFMALCACVLVGTAQVIGELGNLAFFKAFPPSVLGAWGAGTGIAGVSGTGVYLLLRALNVSNTTIFLMLLPTTVLYYFAFQYLYGRAKECGFAIESARTNSEPVQLSISSVMNSFRHSSNIIFNFAAVYFIEYTIFPGLVDRDTLCPLDDSFLASHAFTFMAAGSAIGVTFSRSSISYFQTDRIWIFTMVMLGSLCLWAYESQTHTILHLFGHTGYFVLIAWAAFNGLVGGACYVNAMYAFNTRPGIPDDVRELSINIAFVLSNTGVAIATGLSTVLHNTVMSSEALYPGGCPSPIAT